MQSETVEKLWSKFAFFRISRTDQHKARRMLDRNTFTLNFIDSGDRNVEQQIDEMIFEQVYFVDVQKTAIRARKQSGIESFATGRQRALDIDGPAHSILSCSQRKLDNRHRHLFRSDLRSAALIAQLAFRITVIRTAGNDVDLRQQVSQARAPQSTSLSRDGP